MERQEFVILTYEEKVELLWNKGKFLVTENVGDDLCDAYELFDFYVALSYKLNKSFRPEIISADLLDDLLPF